SWRSLSPSPVTQGVNPVRLRRRPRFPATPDAPTLRPARNVLAQARANVLRSAGVLPVETGLRVLLVLASHAGSVPRDRLSATHREVTVSHGATPSALERACARRRPPRCRRLACQSPRCTRV